MRLTSGAALAATCCSIATASTVRVYTHDPNWQPAAAGQLSPIEARLVLAQRAGVEDYHEADLSRDGVLDAINAYGVRRSVFPSADSQATRAFIFFDGDYDENSQDLSHAFDISPAPSAQQSRDFFIDLATQLNPTQLADLTDNDRLAALRSCNTPPPGYNYLCIANSAQEVSDLVSNLMSTSTWSITMVQATTSSILDSLVPHSASWGTYEMPSTQSPLHKRREPAKETPLEMDPAELSTFTTHSSTADELLSTFASNSTSNSSTTLHGILPACFATLSACQSTTQNCTGHGSCIKKYTDVAADPKSPFKDCYACACSATISTDSEGRTSTTNWGGPACQKKDVSSAFWLIVLFVVGMMFLIGFAVGEVWGMGEQELPSVIGAGVSGPVKR